MQRRIDPHTSPHKSDPQELSGANPVQDQASVLGIAGIAVLLRQFPRLCVSMCMQVSEAQHLVADIC